MLLSNLYFRLRPLVPRPIRLSIRRWSVQHKRQRVRDTWPILLGSERPPHGWTGWPEGKQFAFVLTHDVEGQRGLDHIKKLAELEMELGFRSSFNFVPEGEYRVPAGLPDWLTGRGFEVGVHDLHHDGKLYSSKKSFLRKAQRINRYLKEWKAVGFRSGFMLHKLEWLHELDIQYDTSTFDTDPFEPQPDGVETIFPFWVARKPEVGSQRSEVGLRTSGGDSVNHQPSTINYSHSQPSTINQPRSGYLELPYTLPQDSTLFLMLRERTIEIWKRKLDWIAEHGGMALVGIHPDYIRFGDTKIETRTYPAQLVIDLLKYVRQKYGDFVWHALPREAALHCSSMPATKPGRRKRVCMVSYSFYESDNRVMRYAKALAARGDHVDVIALSRTDDTPIEETLDGVHIHRVQRRERNEKDKFAYLGRILRFLVVSGFALTRKHLKQRYDIVHVHNVPDFLVFSACFAKFTGAAVILDIHDIVPEFYASKFPSNGGDGVIGPLKVLERISAGFADHVIISNHLWYEVITSRSVKREKCTVFINYVDTGVFRRVRRERKDDRLLVIYPGGLQWHQGLDIAIRAFTKVSERIPSAEFHIYGEGPMKDRLVSLAHSLKLSDKIRFFQSLPTREIVAFMAQADLGVVPKRANSFGDQAYSTKIMEFMSLGVPVVVSKTRIDSFYFDDSLVRFFDSGDEDALADAITEVLSNECLRERLIRNSCDYAMSNNWNTRKREYFALVDRLTTSTRPSIVANGQLKGRTSPLCEERHNAAPR